MPETARYFELNDDVGLAPAFLTGPDGNPVKNPAAGTPEPISVLTLQIAVPVMVGKGVAETTSEVTLKPVAGTRIVEITDPLLANAMGTHPLFHEIDAPTKKQLADARKTTNDAASGGKED